MHHESGFSVMAWIFMLSNLVITAGYVSVPFLVLRYLPLTKIVLFWGIIFFFGCGATHLGMALIGHGDPGWFWTAEHAIQAVGTWGFIVTFHRMLRAAHARRRPQAGGGDQG